MKNQILVVVDMQNDFIDGSLGTNEALNIVDSVCELIKKEEYKAIFFTKDTHYNDYFDTLEGRKLPVKHCILGTKGWDLNDKIKEAMHTSKTKYIDILTKYTFGSELLLKQVDGYIDEETEIVLCGLCTDICVVSNALLLRAKYPNAIIKVVKDCCAGVTPETHDAALKTMKMCQIDII